MRCYEHARSGVPRFLKSAHCASKHELAQHMTRETKIPARTQMLPSVIAVDLALKRTNTFAYLGGLLSHAGLKPVAGSAEEPDSRP